MGDNPTFLEMMQRVRGGEMAAAEELVRNYEPAVRRAIRVRIISPALRRVADSMDICQSVMGSFFVRAALGQYDLQQPEQLVGLLFRLARNKVADLARREQAERRDHRRIQQDGSAIERVKAAGDSPSQIVAGAELLRKFREKLTAEERYLAEQRAQGQEWKDIAVALGEGETAEGLRKRLQRAVDRVSREMGLEDLIHDE